MQPAARRLYVIAGSAPVDRRWQSIARRLIERRGQRFETTYLFERTYDELLAEVSGIPRDSIVLLLNVLRDSAGRTFFIPGEVAKTLAELSPAPVYSPYYHLLKGPLGGFTETYESMGSTAADIVLEILAGKNPATIPPRSNPDIGYRVDFKAMQRWGLSEKNLPPATIVMDRNPGLWQLYRWYVIGAVSLILVQTLLIAGLVAQRRRRQAAEASTRAKESALRVSYEQVRHLNGQLINAQEDERARIARELHDDVGQRIASLSIGLSGLKRRSTVADEAARDEISKLQRNAVSLAKDLRNLSHELHPGALQHVGLHEALRARCEEISVESNIKIHFDVAGEWTEVGDEVTLCLYRVAQEGLRNIVRHAGARMCRISLVHEGSQIVMRLADDGRGFKLNSINGQRGIGLLSMRERVGMLGGRFEVQSTESAGTVAIVSIPTGARD
jgi:signal transduction histidine kinase